MPRKPGWNTGWALAWPMPAVAVWLGAWGWYAGLLELGLAQPAAVVLAAALGMLASLWADSRWRRGIIALGFPLSWMFLNLNYGAGLSPWWWLLPAAVCLLLYPPRAWKDAPLYPTPPEAFDGLRGKVLLPPAARVLDAGCGLGHGLQALERAYPDARLFGIERSWPLRLLCAARVPHATVQHGDIWAEDWSGYDLVYLFQRPESMLGAWDKACRELRPGAWLASLEFPVPGVTPTEVWDCPDGRTLWLYQPRPPTAA
jgi:SAM-dependent methyltransferase